ncbi:MAG: response regulator [Bacteroidales bacterium]|nr:response regulator [Bacteroidales bacterium]
MKTILIVDDDIDYLSQMELQVKRLGYDVVTADTQKEGEELIGKRKFDLAIIDLMMENKDSGFILCYKMKQKNPSMPVIIASAVTAETGLSFGVETAADRSWIKADTFIEKGIRPDQLEREINKLLKI